jgi:hypothetical protein
MRQFGIDLLSASGGLGSAVTTIAQTIEQNNDGQNKGKNEYFRQFVAMMATPTTEVNGEKPKSNPAFKILGQLVGLYAAYLSWVCNAELSTGMRVFWALIAYFFGFIYLIYFFAYKKGLCSSGSKPEFNPITFFKGSSAGSASAASASAPSAYLRF